MTSSPITPNISLTRTAPKALSPTKLVSINGKLHWVTVLSKTGSGDELYHHLDQDHWKELSTHIQRIFLANLDRASQGIPYIPLVHTQSDLVEISLDDATAPIKYYKEKTASSLSDREMNVVTTYTGHDLLKELRQTFRHYPVTPYLNEAKKTQQAALLAQYSAEYADKHHHIHNLHTHLDKDITKETFEFYTEALKESRCETLPISDAKTFDPTTLSTTKPVFIPITAHSIKQKPFMKPPILSDKPHLLGLYIDPVKHQVFIYDPIDDKKNWANYPDIKNIIEALKKKDPSLEIIYKGSKEQDASQEKRRLVLFLQAMISPQKERKFSKLERLQSAIYTEQELKLKKVTQAINTSLEEQCLELAQEIQTRHNRTYERIQVLGS